MAVKKLLFYVIFNFTKRTCSYLLYGNIRGGQRASCKINRPQKISALEQIQQFLGHARLETTQIYAASTAAMIKESYQKALGR